MGSYAEMGRENREGQERQDDRPAPAKARELGIWAAVRLPLCEAQRARGKAEKM